MKTTISFFLACVLATQLSFAQAPAGAPAGATGLCNDGPYYTGATKQGACRGHKGVKEWYGSTSAPAAKTPAASTPAPAPASKTPAASSSSTPASTPSPAAKAPGSMSAPTSGGAAQVWVNTASNVYHCPGTRFYGKTKAGAYMSESEAIAKGARPDHGKACK